MCVNVGAGELYSAFPPTFTTDEFTPYCGMRKKVSWLYREHVTYADDESVLWEATTVKCKCAQGT